MTSQLLGPRTRPDATATANRSQFRRPGTKVLLIGGLVVIALLVWWRWPRPVTTATQTSRTVTVALGTVKQTVTASGTIAPAVQAALSFGSAGTVSSLSVKVGDAVTKGQVLATLDTTALRQAVTLAQASVNAASQQVTAAGTATAQRSAAQVQLVSAQAQLAAAQDNLAAATLKAPFAGVVAAVNITAGQTSSGGGSSTAGGSGTSAGGSSGSGAGGSNPGSNSGGSNSGGSNTGAGSASSGSSSDITVIATKSWLVNATVGTSDLPLLKAGLQATITPTGATQPIFGTVSSVGVVASSTSSGAAQFPVTIAITGTPPGLYAGTTAAVAITVKQLSDVLTVPTAAVSTQDGTTVVTVSKDGQSAARPVTIGQVFGGTTQIVSGLSEGEEVVVTGVAGFRSGTGTGQAGTGQSGSGQSGSGRTGQGGGFGGGFGPGIGQP